MANTRSSSAGQHPSGLFWIHSGADETGALDTLAAMFEGVSPSDLLTTNSTAVPGVVEPHYHTEDIAAFIISGRLAFDVGPGYADRIEFGPGDCIFVPAMLPHGEQVLGNEPVNATMASLLAFDTEPV